jgi:hypothetical protein
MSAGMTWRKRDSTLRQEGQPSGLAIPDSVYSRRRTVTAALHRANGVTREYQSDSSSKRPASSVVFGLQGGNG